MDDHAVDDAVVLRFLRSHEVIALHVLRDFLHRLSRVLRHDLLESALEGDRLPGVDLDVGRLPLEAAPDLVDEDLGVRQRHPLSFRSAGKKERAHRHRRANANRLHVGLDELHRVVDGEPVVDGATRRVDIDRDVLVGILGLQVQELRDDQVGDLVVDGCSEKADALVQQARVDVERTLAARGLLDHHRDQRAHAGSLLLGVHSFVSVGGDSLSGVQMLSRARATSAGTRRASAATRSSALRSRRSARRVSWAPPSKTCLIASSGSSPCTSLMRRSMSARSSSSVSNSLAARASSSSSGGSTFSFNSLSVTVAFGVEPSGCSSSSSLVSPTLEPISARSSSSSRRPVPSSTTRSRWPSPDSSKASITATSPVRAGRSSTGVSSATDERSSSSSWSTTSCGTSGSTYGTSSFVQSAGSGFGCTETVAVKLKASSSDSGTS